VTAIATAVCVGLGLLLALAAGIQALRNRPVTKYHIYGAALTEFAVLFYLGVRIAALAGGHRTSGLVVVLAYLAILLLAMPITAALAWAEPSRWGSVTLAAGALVTCVLFQRINQLWTPHG
jgi:hypothetical protein